MSLLLTTCYGHGISRELEGWFQGIAHNVTVSSARYYLSYLIHEVAELWDSGILGVFCISPAQRDSHSIQRNWRKIIFCYIKSIAFSAYLKSLRLTS